jgi:alkylation response protein AidB-like acyl-CoA dehydrogenase
LTLSWLAVRRHSVDEVLVDSRILSRRDLEFMLYEWLDVETLTHRPRFGDHSRETFDAVLTLCERLATEKFANHNRKADLDEAHLDGQTVQMVPEISAAVTAFTQAGLTAAGQSADLGGLQLPTVIEKAGLAWFLAANVATASLSFITTANANLLLAHGAPWMIDSYVRPMLQGRFFGTMCLTESHAGSSLAQLRTRAVPEADGTYRVFGSKMWISAGDHELGENIIHLVLARLPQAPEGVKGISLFLVPRKLLDAEGQPGERNDVAVAGLNHKMGQRGVPNCLLSFGEGVYRPGGEPGAVGWLVGKPHEGLAAMFHMMNEARVGVGLMATALGYTAYLHALDYARSRPQGYAPGPRSNLSKPSFIIEHTDVRRMLLAQKCYAEGALALNLYCARLIDEERTAPELEARDKAHLLLELLTPIAKSWPAQWCLEGCSLAIQVHGGYGYSREYAVEQFYRDNRINSIHEGTHGIHGLDLLGRKVSMADGAAFKVLVDAIQRAIDASESVPRLSEFGRQLQAVLQRLIRVTLLLCEQREPQIRLANSTSYLEATGHLVIGWMWLEQMRAAAQDTPFHRGKRQAGQYFFRWELPKADIQLARIEALDDTNLRMEDSWF